MSPRDEYHEQVSRLLREEKRLQNRLTVECSPPSEDGRERKIGMDEDEHRQQQAEREQLRASTAAYFDRAPFDDLANALASLPKGTLWCVGSMEDGPFARLVLPQAGGGYGGGYREAFGDTPTQAIARALGDGGTQV